MTIEEERMRKILNTEYKCFTVEEFKSIREDLDRLEQYKSIEKELGISLITLFQALKEGIYDKYIYYDDVCLLGDKIYACPLDIFDTSFYLKDYGKTWALTREELKNDK